MMTMNWKLPSVSARTVLAALCLGVVACDFSVTNPGSIPEENLEEPTDVTRSVLLNGLIGDVEDAFDDLILHTGLASDELTFSGTRSWLDSFSRGDIRSSDTNETWDDAAKASWAAVTGVTRLEELEASAEEIAAANLYAGFIHRLMGDTFCSATFDGGPEMDNAEYYTRALSHFEAAEGGSGEIATAAKAGQAQAHLILGNHAEAEAAAADVPDDFVWVAHYTDNDESLIWSETHSQTQVTVFGTPVADLGENGDPRAPWTDQDATGAGGVVAFYRQEKYTERGDDIPLAKGWEMRLIEAEVALVNGDVDGAMSKINQVRTSAGLDAKSAASAEEAWAALDHERMVTLWLEARRLKDIDRWDSEFLDGRSRCFVFSDAEYNSNPNLTRP